MGPRGQNEKNLGGACGSNSPGCWNQSGGGGGVDEEITTGGIALGPPPGQPWTSAEPPFSGRPPDTLGLGHREPRQRRAAM